MDYTQKWVCDTQNPLTLVNIICTSPKGNFLQNKPDTVSAINLNMLKTLCWALPQVVLYTITAIHNTLHCTKAQAIMYSKYSKNNYDIST